MVGGNGMLKYTLDEIGNVAPFTNMEQKAPAPYYTVGSHLHVDVIR